MNHCTPFALKSENWKLEDLETLPLIKNCITVPLRDKTYYAPDLEMYLDTSFALKSEKGKLEDLDTLSPSPW